MKTEIEITVTVDGQELTCKLRRPDVATLSRVAKLGRADEVLAAQELVKGCWVSGDEILKTDGFLMAEVARKVDVFSKNIKAEIKN